MKRDKIKENLEGGGNIQRLQHQLAKVDNEINNVKNPPQMNQDAVHISPSTISEDSFEHVKANAVPPTHAESILPSSTRTKLTSNSTSPQSVGTPLVPPPYESHKHELPLPSMPPYHLNNTRQYLPGMYLHDYSHTPDTGTLNFQQPQPQYLFNSQHASPVGNRNILPPIHELFKQMDQQHEQ